MAAKAARYSQGTRVLPFTPNLANHTPSFKPPLLYWCIQREVYRSLAGGSILIIKFSRYSVIKTSSTYSLPLL